MPPSGLRSRNFAIGESCPSGSSSSILVFGSVMKTVVTPWSGCGTGSETCAPSVWRYTFAALPMSRTAIATWLSRPIMTRLLRHRLQIHPFFFNDTATTEKAEFTENRLHLGALALEILLQ